MAKHRQNGHDDCKWQRPPETPPEVDQFGILLFFQRGHYRFKCHAAFWAIARRWLPDFRVHRARVNRTFWHSLCWFVLDRIHIGFRVGPEFIHAPRAAEVVGDAIMLQRLLWIGGNLHSTNRVGEGLGWVRRSFSAMTMMAAAPGMQMGMVVVMLVGLAFHGPSLP
jgi:hypothetical protein